MFMYSTQRNFFLFLSLSRCSLETTEQAEIGRDGSDCHEDSSGALCVDCMYMYIIYIYMYIVWVFVGRKGAYDMYIIIHTWKRGTGMCSTGGN